MRHPFNSNNIMNDDDLQHIRTTVNKIDSLSIEIMELIVDFQRNEDDYFDSCYSELAEALEDVTNAVTEFQEQQEWI